MKVAITGASGLVGSAVSARLKERGHEVVALQRSKSALREGDILWNPEAGEVDLEKLEGVEGVINLMGENIASKRWNARRKKRFSDSRILGTKNLVAALSSLKRAPKVLISASAVGYYGDTQDLSVDESSPPGKGFLASLCKGWEEAAEEALERGTRLVKLRIGVVLSPSGGALKKMLLPFKLCLGGKIGSGKQYMSWIALDDLTALIEWALLNDAISGAVNAVAPHPVTNSEFTKSLGRAVKRPTPFPLPAPLARCLFGEMADELLLSSCRAYPKVLLAEKFPFSMDTLDKALEEIDYRSLQMKRYDFSLSTYFYFSP